MLAVLFRSFDFIAPKNLFILLLSNLSILSVPDESYSRCASLSQNLISTFLLKQGNQFLVTLIFLLNRFQTMDDTFPWCYTDQTFLTSGYINRWIPVVLCLDHRCASLLADDGISLFYKYTFHHVVSEEKIFRNRPIRNKNRMWRPCLLMELERNEYFLQRTAHRCFLPSFRSFG